MSYPPARYLGEIGEVSVRLRRASHPAELPSVSGGGAHCLATGASTGGEFGIYRWDMGPSPSGPDAHFHKTISESFFILSGTVRLYGGDAWVDDSPGDFLFVPEGGVHAFRNESGQPASMHLLFALGATREDYFETVADPARREAMNDEQRAEFFLRHDTHWL